MAAALHFAFTQTENLAEFQGFCDLVKGFLAHQIGAQARHLAFGQGRETPKKFKSNDAVQDRVANEFEPFVMGRAVAAVSKRRLQQARVGKNVADSRLEPARSHSPLPRPAVEAWYSISRLTGPKRGIRLS